MRTDVSEGTVALSSAKTPRDKSTAASPRGKSPRLGDNHVGRALRSAYHETVQEDIPQEMLDLLGKLT